MLDLAPDPIEGIGGKLSISTDSELIYLTAAIAAPRLTGKDEDHTQRLAEENARRIEALFIRLRTCRKKILFVNDVTLYLHAGDLGRLVGFLESAGTCVLNAYHGKTFSPSAITCRENELLEKLIGVCDRVECL